MKKEHDFAPPPLVSSLLTFLFSDIRSSFSFSGFNLFCSFSSLVSFASLQTPMGRPKTLEREERLNLIPSENCSTEGKFFLCRLVHKEEKYLAR